MANRILSRINGAYVIATIALFAALGGGYAVAFSGSGSLQKAGEVGILGSSGGTATDEVRTLTGIGAIGAGCDTSASGNIHLKMRNSTGVTLSVLGQSDLGNINTAVSTGNEYGTIFSAPNNTDLLDLYVAQTDGTKRPQAHIGVTINETGNCATSSVQVLALNTQE